jgi:hypothetical protein
MGGFDAAATSRESACTGNIACLYRIILLVMLISRFENPPFEARDTTNALTLSILMPDPLSTS